jgi:nitrate reductase NapAB chaperone NapD
MPIKSYLALANESQLENLRNELLELGCEVVPAENKDVLIVVTETASETEDEALLERLQGLQHLRHLTLVSAFEDEKS